MAEKPNWDTLTEVQLKGSLVRRGLSTDGTKEELVSRLKLYGTDESPVLLKSRMLYGYYVNKAIRTVLITPFIKEVMTNKAFYECLEQTTTYQIQKTMSGKSAVKLVFKNVDLGDAMYFKLKNQLSGFDVEVLHPANPSTRSERTDEISKIFRVSEQYGDRLLKRTVILEKLAAGINTEDKLTELFPEALDVVSFQFDQPNTGIAILEFASEQEVDDFIKTSGNEMDLEGDTVTVNKFQTRQKEIMKAHSSKKKTSEEETPSLDKEGRLALIEEINALDRELLDLGDNTEVSGKDKVNKVCHLNEVLKNKQKVLNADTRRRLAAEETDLPEGQERMLKCTEQLLARYKEIAESKENGTIKSTPKKKTNGEISKDTKDVSKTKVTGKSPGKGGNSTTPKKKPAKVVSMKGISSKPRPGTTQGRGQNRMQMGNYQRNIQSAGPSFKSRQGGSQGYGQIQPLMGSYPRNGQSPRQVLLPDQRQALVRGRGMNRNMQPGMPGSMNQFGYNNRTGQQNYQQQRMNRQYEDAGESQASAKMIVEGLTTVLTEKVRELEQIHQHNLQGQQQLGHPGNYDERSMHMNRNYDSGRMPLDQERYMLEQFYQGGYENQPMMGYDQTPPSPRGVYEERAPYTNFRRGGQGVSTARGFRPPGSTFDNAGGGYGHGTGW